MKISTEMDLRSNRRNSNESFSILSVILYQNVNILCQHYFYSSSTINVNKIWKFLLESIFTRSQTRSNEKYTFFLFFFFFKYIFIIEHNTALIRCEKLKIVVKTDLRGWNETIVSAIFNIGEHEAVTRTYVHGKLATFPDNSIVTSLIYTTRASAKSKLLPTPHPPFCSSYHRLYFIFPGFGYARAPNCMYENGSFIIRSSRIETINSLRV